MKQRIVFVNLHADWMLLRVAMVYVFKYSAAIKHGYLLKYLLEHPDEYEVCNYINSKGFSLYTKADGLLGKLLNCLSGPENRITLRKNGISPNRIKVLRNPEEIRRDDIIIMYNICNDAFVGIEDVDAFKAVSMIHFHGRSGEDEAIRKTGASVLFNEVNLQDNSELFRRYYPKLSEMPWIIHPFVYAGRFQRIRPFAQRQNKCFSTGTITYKNHPEFISVYGDPCDQPARKFVKDMPEFFADTVDCYNSDYLEDNPGKTVNPNDNPVVKLYKRIYNRTHVGKQKKYFSFDMVEKFNDYKMHIVGEEILGIPGIGFVEGMACGSAYIGLEIPAYRDWGLIPGEHYITYDGTPEGLRSTIEFWQRPENQEELERIANAGWDFVCKNFNGPTVAKKMIKEIALAQNRWLKNQK